MISPPDPRLDTRIVKPNPEIDTRMSKLNPKLDTRILKLSPQNPKLGTRDRNPTPDTLNVKPVTGKWLPERGSSRWEINSRRES